MEGLQWMDAVVSDILVPIVNVAVILTRKSSLDLLIGPGVLEGVYVSGIRAMPWNEDVEFVMINLKVLFPLAPLEVPLWSPT